MTLLSVLNRLVQRHKPDQTGQSRPVRLAQYNTYDARAIFSQLLLRVFEGEEIVIARAGVPVAKLVPYAGEPVRAGVLRAHLFVDQDAPLENAA
jgi:prevent-host-death family protein